MKKIVIIGCTLLILLTFSSPSFGINFFPDVFDHWSEGYVYWATYEAALFRGYEDGTFRPDNHITRAEYVTVLNRLLHIKNMYSEKPLLDNIELVYDDLDNTFWAYEDIIELGTYIDHYANIDITMKSIFKGNDFHPNQPITRYEAAVLARTITTPPIELIEKEFVDVTKDLEFYDAIIELTSNGIILGYPDNTFRPYNNITRAEAATILMKIYNDLDYLDINYLEFKPIQIESFEDKYPLFEINEDEIYENQQNQKFVIAVTTLEYLTFVDQIAPEEMHLYDPDPIKTLWDLKKEGYSNVIGNNYYLIGYDRTLNYEGKVELIKEALQHFDTVEDKDIKGMTRFLSLIKDYILSQGINNMIVEEAEEIENIKEIEETDDIDETKKIEETDKIENELEKGLGGTEEEEVMIIENIPLVYITWEEFIKAVEMYYGATTEFSEKLQMGVLLGELYLEGKEPEKAVSIYEELLSDYTDMKTILQLITNYSFLLYEIKGGNSAIDYLFEAWEKLKQHPEYHLYEIEIEYQFTSAIKQLLMVK